MERERVRLKIFIFMNFILVFFFLYCFGYYFYISLINKYWVNLNNDLRKMNFFLKFSIIIKGLLINLSCIDLFRGLKWEVWIVI